MYIIYLLLDLLTPGKKFLYQLAWEIDDLFFEAIFNYQCDQNDQFVILLAIQKNGYIYKYFWRLE